MTHQELSIFYTNESRKSRQESNVLQMQTDSSLGKL